MADGVGTTESGAFPHASSSLLTFLIADLRGYTRFTADRGDEAAARLATRFADLAEDVVSAHDGQLIELRGDEVLAGFYSARQALRAALRLETRFATEIGTDFPVEVGIGLDAGDAVPVKEGYRTGALNLAARLQSLAHGEVFASETVVRLAGRTDGIAVIDRGQVSVKGRPQPEQVYQLAVEGEVPAELPPLQPEEVAHPTNLPDEPTQFIGREHEIEALIGLLRDPRIRLVTLTGPGGSGKTRLALQVANQLLPDFEHGVYFVDLAPLTDPHLAPSVVAEVLQVKEEPGRDILESLTDRLKDKYLLLVLDNFEHLLDASPGVASLLDGCRGLHLLVTSRVPLHLTREHEYPVGPLALPDLGDPADVQGVLASEAVALFVDRARAAKPDFAVTTQNAAAVGEICTQLDGLPLAIELAAARIRLFPPPALLQRLSNRLTLLTGGARDLPVRQQTLRNTIDWSYSLLTEEEQTLFIRLSVFAAGCTFEAAEAVCNRNGDLDLLGGLTSLVEKSLVRQGGNEEPRFSMLETIREYAAEKLQSSAEAEQIGGYLADYFLSLAETGRASSGPTQPEWLERLEGEHDNLRAVLAWLVERNKTSDLAQLAVALSWFWAYHGHSAEGQRWLEAAAARVPEDGLTRARARYALGVLLRFQGEYRSAQGHYREALRLARELGNTRLEVAALYELGLMETALGDVRRGEALLMESVELESKSGEEGFIPVWLGWAAGLRGDYDRGRALLKEALERAREREHPVAVALSLTQLGWLERRQGNDDRARVYLEEAIGRARHLGHRPMVGLCLNSLSWVAMSQGNDAHAVDLAQETVALDRDMGITGGKVESLHALGVALWKQGNGVRAEEVLRGALSLGRKGELTLGTIPCLEAMAALCGDAGRLEAAARLSGATAALRERSGAPQPPNERRLLQGALDRARAQLGEEAWRAAEAEGRVMRLEEAVTYALSEQA